MSVFTNPASRSVEDAEAYVRAVLGLVGDRDPFEILESTPRALRDAVSGMEPDALSTPEAPDKWSIRHVIRHLADSEIVWGVRLRMVLAEDRPRLAGFDQDAWASRLRYGAARLAESLEEFEALRRGHLRLLRRAPREDLRRVGVHAERGEESVEHMIRLYAGHDLLHLRQIERIRESVRR